MATKKRKSQEMEMTKEEKKALRREIRKKLDPYKKWIPAKQCTRSGRISRKPLKFSPSRLGPRELKEALKIAEEIEEKSDYSQSESDSASPEHIPSREEEILEIEDLKGFSSSSILEDKDEDYIPPEESKDVEENDEEDNEEGSDEDLPPATKDELTKELNDLKAKWVIDPLAEKMAEDEEKEVQEELGLVEKPLLPEEGEESKGEAEHEEEEKEEKEEKEEVEEAEVLKGKEEKEEPQATGSPKEKEDKEKDAGEDNASNDLEADSGKEKKKENIHLEPPIPSPGKLCRIDFTGVEEDENAQIIPVSLQSQEPESQ